MSVMSKKSRLASPAPGRSEAGETASGRRSPYSAAGGLS